MENWAKYKELIKEEKKIWNWSRFETESLSPTHVFAMALRDDVTDQNAEAIT